MNTQFRFADWNPTRGTVPAYLQDSHSGQISIGEAIIGDDGQPVDQAGWPLSDDGSTVELVGWAHTTCASYCSGRVLLPLKGSRA